MVEVDLKALEEKVDWEFTEMIKRRQRIGYEVMHVQEFRDKFLTFYMMHKGDVPLVWIGRYYWSGTIESMHLNDIDINSIRTVFER